MSYEEVLEEKIVNFCKYIETSFEKNKKIVEFSNELCKSSFPERIKFIELYCYKYKDDLDGYVDNMIKEYELLFKNEENGKEIRTKIKRYCLFFNKVFIAVSKEIFKILEKK